MSRLVLVLFALSLTLTASLARAQSAPVNIMGGPEGSTSLQIGEEIQELASGCGIESYVHQSAGALDNLLAVKDRVNTQFGIIQNDVLEYLVTYEPEVPDIASAMRGIKVAFPLFPQEVQVLVNPGITTLADLNGKRVSIGDRDSGTFLTATVMLDIMSIEPAERAEYRPAEALAAMVAGDIDAMFFVDGVPSKLLDRRDLGVLGMRLLPVDDPILGAVYAPGVIPAGTYPYVTEDLPTVTVRAVMIAYDYVPKGRNRYNTVNCNMVSALSGLVSQRLDELRSDGHPKWSQVDPGVNINDFEIARCAERGRDPNFRLVCE